MWKRILFPVLTLSALTATLVAGGEPSANNRIVCNLVGTAEGELRTLDLPEGPVEALCFDVNLVDVATGRVIGRGSDCLYDIQPDGAGMTLKDVTIFRFRNGEIHSLSEVGVQPTSAGFEGVTHLTGSKPGTGANNVLAGFGHYAGAEGSVRLSGMVDMSQLESQNEISFDCLFVIDLDQ